MDDVVRQVQEQYYALPYTPVMASCVNPAIGDLIAVLKDKDKQLEERQATRRKKYAIRKEKLPKQIDAKSVHATPLMVVLCTSLYLHTLAYHNTVLSLMHSCTSHLMIDFTSWE